MMLSSTKPREQSRLIDPICGDSKGQTVDSLYQQPLTED